MANRNEFLDAVRKALKTEGEERQISTGQPLPPPLQGVMAAIPPGELLERFESELKGLGGKTHRASSLPMLEGIIRSILEQTRASSAVLSRNPLLGSLQLVEIIEGWGIKAARWPGGGQEPAESAAFRQDCFAAQVGITGADFALAETGSLILTSLTEGSQLASLAPVTHVVLYRHSQLRATLDEVLQNLPVSLNPNQPSPARSVVFVTGTSRTADIEQILVRGVHGPKELHAILVEESCIPG